jgi:hypothetical protein
LSLAMRDFTSRSAARLDRVEALVPHEGRLDLHGILRADRHGGLAGGALSLEHRWQRTSIYGEAWGGYGWGAVPGWQVGIEGGLRMRF